MVVATPPAFIGHDNSQLGVIVDRSSFDEEDEFGLFPKDLPLIIDEDQSVSDSSIGAGDATIMRNGKVRRKLRWKPPGFRRNKKKSSSNQSVVSALTTKSSATHRSTSTNRSFLSHFSKRSQNSFHTFHSTETPVVKNSRQSQHTFQRPNYQDNFEGGTGTTTTTTTTIATEGRHVSKKMEASPAAIDTINLDRSNTLPSRLDSNFPISPMSESSVQFMDPFGESVAPIKPLLSPLPEGATGKLDKSAKRPPLFRRAMKMGMGRPPMAGKSTSFTVVKTPMDPPSMDLSSDTVPTIVSSESPLSENVSTDYSDSNLPTLEEYDEDRRVALCLGSSQRLDPPGERTDDSVNDMGSVNNNSIIDTNSVANSSKASGASPVPPGAPEPPSPCPSSATSSVRKRYNRPVDTTTTTISIGSDDNTTGDDGKRRSSVPVDLDEGAFLEAEHNLRAIHDMAAEHLAHGEFEEAIEVFEEILRGQRERYGNSSYRVGTALHNLGLVHMKGGDHEKAIEYCQQAVDVRREALVPNHPDVAVSLAQLGVAHLEFHQYEESLDIFREALHIRKNFLGPRHPKCAKILNNIGCALYSLEEYEEAQEAYEEALEIQRDVLRMVSDDGPDLSGASYNNCLLSIASTLCNLGSIKSKEGLNDEAEVLLQEALLIQQSVLPEDHPAIQMTLDNIEFIELAGENTLISGGMLLSRWATMQGTHIEKSEGGVMCVSQPVLEEVINLEEALNAMSPQTWFEQVGDAIAEKTGCASAFANVDVDHQSLFPSPCGGVDN